MIVRTWTSHWRGYTRLGSSDNIIRLKYRLAHMSSSTFFSRARSASGRFLKFSAASERESENRKWEAKDFEKVWLKQHVVRILYLVRVLYFPRSAARSPQSLFYIADLKRSTLRSKAHLPVKKTLAHFLENVSAMIQAGLRLLLA